jgi:hypothetical protein
MPPRPNSETEKGAGVKRLHLHVLVDSLPAAVRFYSDLFDTAPCCGGKSYANWRIDEPPVNLAASVTDRPTGIAHFGLEAESPGELTATDRVLHGSLRRSGAVPWEISVRKRPVRKERPS